MGGGYWAHFTVLPARYAWDVFGTGNGAATFDEMARRIGRYRLGFDVHTHVIGCVALIQPVFLPPEEWIEPPKDWKPQIQVGRTYDTTDATGASVWTRFEAARGRHVVAQETRDIAADADRFGTPALVAPRLGQGTFRARVFDGYERRCAVTSERTLPVLEATHIKPYSMSGPYATDSGLLLRSDLHTLLDRGYVTGHARTPASSQSKHPRRVRERPRLQRA